MSLSVSESEAMSLRRASKDPDSQGPTGFRATVGPSSQTAAPDPGSARSSRRARTCAHVESGVCSHTRRDPKSRRTRNACGMSLTGHTSMTTQFCCDASDPGLWRNQVAKDPDRLGGGTAALNEELRTLAFRRPVVGHNRRVLTPRWCGRRTRCHRRIRTLCLPHLCWARVNFRGDPEC